MKQAKECLDAQNKAKEEIIWKQHYSESRKPVSCVFANILLFDIELCNLG